MTVAPTNVEAMHFGCWVCHAETVDHQRGHETVITLSCLLDDVTLNEAYTALCFAHRRSVDDVVKKMQADLHREDWRREVEAPAPDRLARPQRQRRLQEGRAGLIPRQGETVTLAQRRNRHLRTERQMLRSVRYLMRTRNYVEAIRQLAWALEQATARDIVESEIHAAKIAKIQKAQRARPAKGQER